MWSFIKFLQGEENRFHHLRIQFYACLGARPKQTKTIAIQRRIENLGQRYYDGVISAMEYLDGLSYTVAKRKKIAFYIFFCFIFSFMFYFDYHMLVLTYTIKHTSLKSEF
ncbi:unnamed protein product [Rotaria magnacalcarata]|uniref:Uncharacterized protein n=3 Tax=Rotaria magnacalcarata TaxID=392030 RepID=A0A816WLC7_9BILA|nr:unnamed protein product [Rotaria magnacalcarata]CAF1683050.1 unnamed protein product [Rotaria magnacalcarata]CAF2135631.1 unnamed protein product [Rotaria magnacalcarata]CAF5072943.1 unnamed protein product [Rotaria magnacalcarata]CAF5187281.1 unnamed protein product [Rotaria magnacalcarata]